MVKKEIENEVKMISAVSRALELKRIEQDNEKILSQISDLASLERSEGAKLGMIVAASKALDIAERNPRMKEKEIIKKVTEELSSMKKNLD